MQVPCGKFLRVSLTKGLYGIMPCLIELAVHPQGVGCWRCPRSRGELAELVVPGCWRCPLRFPPSAPHSTSPSSEGSPPTLPPPPIWPPHLTPPPTMYPPHRSSRFPIHSSSRYKPLLRGYSHPLNIRSHRALAPLETPPLHLFHIPLPSGGLGSELPFTDRGIVGPATLASKGILATCMDEWIGFSQTFERPALMYYTDPIYYTRWHFGILVAQRQNIMAEHFGILMDSPCTLALVRHASGKQPTLYITYTLISGALWHPGGSANSRHCEL